QAQEAQTVRTPVVHALGIVGERDAVYSYTRAMLANFAVFHAPIDAKIYVIAARQREWEWAFELPHCQGGEQRTLCCFLDTIAEDEDGAPQSSLEDEEQPLVIFMEGLRRELAQRRLQLEEHDENNQSASATPALPLLLVVIDLLDAAYDDQSPLRDIENDAALSILLDAGPILGASVLFLAPDRRKAPTRCNAVIEVEKTAPAANRKSQQRPEPSLPLCRNRCQLMALCR
ncbi:MAG: hypothetical protein IPK16_28475, partial [Anaerolineales bacterium]|nr:hypothetical protein [Anaerolineales bacterium]